MMFRKRVLTIILCLAIYLLIASYVGGKKETFSSESGPETCTLGGLAKVYEPAIFSHEMHTFVTEGCAGCHHHSGEGETPSCSECHGAASAKDLGVTGLKEAYHSLCTGCHKEMEMGPTGCTGCHAMKTTKMPAVSKESSKTGPEIRTLNSLQKVYEPVIFSHEMHTLAAEDCAMCHHHSAAGQTPSCSQCHGAPFEPDNLNLPGLKGAYHLQCMGCHKELASGPVGCTECHAKKASDIKEPLEE